MTARRGVADSWPATGQARQVFLDRAVPLEKPHARRNPRRRETLRPPGFEVRRHEFDFQAGTLRQPLGARQVPGRRQQPDPTRAARFEEPPNLVHLFGSVPPTELADRGGRNPDVLPDAGGHGRGVRDLGDGPVVSSAGGDQVVGAVGVEQARGRMTRSPEWESWTPPSSRAVVPPPSTVR